MPRFNLSSFQQREACIEWPWPKDEQVIDLLHKGVYAFVTGAVADRLLRGPQPPVRSRRNWDHAPTSLPR
jgi:hypothetical protein